MRRFGIIFVLPIFLFAANVNYDNAKKLFTEQQYGQAFAEIQLAIEAEPDNADALAFSAQIALYLDDLETANKNLSSAIEKQPKNNGFRAQYDALKTYRDKLVDADNSYKSGYTDEALSIYKKVSEEHPGFGKPWYSIGLIHYRNGDWADAIFNLKKAAELNPYEEKYQQAIRNIAGKITQDGNIDFRGRNFEMALEKYKEAISYDASYSEPFYRSALSLYYLRMYEEAKNMLDSSLKLNGEHGNSWKLMGDLKRRLKDKDGAEQAYLKAIGVEENFAKAYYSLANLYLSSGRADEASANFEKAIEADPEYVKAYDALGAAYNASEQYQKAVDIFTQALEKSDRRDKNRYMLYFRLAEAFIGLKDYEETLDACNESLNLKKTYYATYYYKGLAEKALGKLEAAKLSFEKAKRDSNFRQSADYQLKLIKKGM